MPTRDLILVIDPASVSSLCSPAYFTLLNLVVDLESIDPPVRIHLMVPKHLTESEIVPLVDGIRPPLSWTTGSSPPPFNVEMPTENSTQLLADTEESRRALNLLAVADAIQADGIVTNSPILLDARYPLYQHHRVRIIPTPEVGDIIESFSHGHSVYWSASSMERYMVFDLFYQLNHWKGARYAKWFYKIGEPINNVELRECLRSSLLNRYPFLLYSRDMIRFYELQMDFYTRRGLQRRFMMGVGYYVTTFYLLLWGMLDHLTITAKWARDLNVDEKHCGIRSKRFWKELRQREPHLKKFVDQPKISKWISMMQTCGTQQLIEHWHYLQLYWRIQKNPK